MRHSHPKRRIVFVGASLVRREASVRSTEMLTPGQMPPIDGAWSHARRTTLSGMSDAPFQRPTEKTHATSQTGPLRQPTPADDVEVSIIVDQERAKPRVAPVRPPKTIRVRSVIAATLFTLLAGIMIGALTIDRPIPGTPITLDSFPRELLGLEREDVAFRDGTADAVIERLDSQFAAQLAGYRFAYGGEGARFRYGDVTSLTIVNGKLAPQVPVSEDTDRGPSLVVSLNSKNTRCVTETVIIHSRVLGAETGTPLEAVNEYSEVRRSEERYMWTDCVLLDDQRNISLRLEGQVPGDDRTEVSGQFRDELERIHANLI